MCSSSEEGLVLVSRTEFDRFEGTVNAEVNPVIYLGIDPGKSNGVCGYDARHYVVFMCTVNSLDMIHFLAMFKKVEKCIIEDYLLYPDKAKQQVYSDMETSRVIGRVESWAELHHVEVIKQGASIKATGYKWIGKKALPKSNPLNHELDAHVHFMHWAIKHGKVNAADLLRNTSPQVLPKS